MNRSIVLLVAIVATVWFETAALAQSAKSIFRNGGPKGDPASWFTDDDFPAEAKRAGAQGRVVVNLTVDTEGRGTDCRVTLSSGSAALDDATCRLARRRGRFFPQIGAQGVPVAYSYPISVYWVLKEESAPMDALDFGLGMVRVDIAPRPFKDTLSVAMVDVDEQGNAVACRSGVNGVSNDVACQGFYPGRKMMAPVLRDGKAVPATITLTRSIEVRARVVVKK